MSHWALSCLAFWWRWFLVVSYPVCLFSRTLTLLLQCFVLGELSQSTSFVLFCKFFFAFVFFYCFISVVRLSLSFRSHDFHNAGISLLATSALSVSFLCIALSSPSPPLLSLSPHSLLSLLLSLSMAILRAACAWDVASKMSPGSVADRIYWCNNCHRVPKRNYHHCDDCGTNRHTQALHLCDSCTAAVVRLQMSGLCLVTEESSRESRTEKESGGEGEEDKERGCVEWEWWLLVIVDHGDWYLCKWLRDERNVERAKRIWCIDREIEQEEEDGMKQEEAKGKE